jgi:MraZ protein
MLLTQNGERCLTVVRRGAECGKLGRDGIPVNKVANDVPISPIYNSVYRHGVDEKRRIQIPSMWRAKDAKVQFTLIVWPQRSEGPCLRVLPPKEMAELMASLDAMPNDETVLKRIIGAESTQVALDSAGRICVPEEMARAANIANEAVLVGLLDRFEIWDPARYEKVKAADAVLAQEAFKLME